jgi:hypothetical protein
VRRALVVSFGVTMLCAVVAGTASAQTFNKKSIVTFSDPVEIPGAQVLPTGTYVFRLIDSMSDRNVVQILSQDEKHIFATILAVPNYRLKPKDTTTITFAERAAGSPQAIRAWFYPADTFGQEFVYPKTKALALAATTKESILYMPDTAVASVKDAPLMAVTPTGSDVAVTDVVAPPPAQTPAQLPHSAGSMPLVALTGLLCLGVGVSLRRLCAS